MTAASELFRKKLNSLFEIAQDEGFIQLLWAVNLLQAGEEAAAAPCLAHRYPKEAVTTNIADKFFIYKWELETLANEVLTVPKRNKYKNGRTRALAINNYNSVVTAINILRKLENSEDVHRLDDVSLYRELARIASRQFDWQRVYAQGDCAAYFETQYGVTINKFSLVGFGLYSALIKHPHFFRHSDLLNIGVSADELQRCLALMTRSLDDMKMLAITERKSTYPTAYRPSVFRRFPCIAFGGGGERIRAPLPQLILERVTGGVFYDVIGGGGTVRKDYGRRFHEYCFNLLRAQLPTMDWRWEEKYRVSSNPIDTPDILLMERGDLGLVIECKATRMGYSAKFGDGDERGFEDLIKGVYQLWRFFSHCRRGISRFTLCQNVVGAILTLDNWLAMAGTLQANVIAAARVMAAEKDPNILPEDQKPIAFFAVTGLEATLTKATAKSFVQAVRACSEVEYQGWLLSTVHDKFEEAGQVPKKYPFRGDMVRLLPWWRMAQSEKASEEL